MNQAELGKLVSALRIAVKPRHRNMATPEGPAGRWQEGGVGLQEQLFFH